MKRRRRWWLAGAAGVVAAISLLMVPALGDGPIIAELGTLRLHLDSDGDRVIFDPIAPGANQVQTLTAQLQTHLQRRLTGRFHRFSNASQQESVCRHEGSSNWCRPDR